VKRNKKRWQYPKPFKLTANRYKQRLDGVSRSVSKPCCNGVSKPLQTVTKKSKKNFKKLKRFNKNISTSPSGALHLTGDNPFIQAN
jgi:glutamine synthetase type III